MFGAVNALFAGLAFAGVIVTVWMQKDELELQRKEIRDNRMVMEGQEKQLSLQRETMQRQQFEATFFQMLNYFIAYRNEMDIGDKNRPKKGTAMFESFNANLHYFYSEEYRIITSPSFQSILNTTWERFRQSSATIIDLYFGLLLRVIRYAHSKAPQEAEMYIHIVRDSLTNEELSVLFFAGASKRYEDLKGLIERYGLLRNHDNHKIVQLPGGPHNFYERKAYR